MPTVPELLQAYDNAKLAIYRHFGYVNEDWRALPLEDDTDKYWFLSGDELTYTTKPFTEELIEEGKNLYGGEVYHNIVHRAGGYTMVAVDTHCDGNIFLVVLDDAKECKDQALIDLCVDA